MSGRYPTAILFLAVASPAVAASAPAQSPGSVLQKAFSSRVDGNPQQIASLFRYFEAVVGAQEASRDREAVTKFLVLLEQDLAVPADLKQLASRLSGSG